MRGILGITMSLSWIDERWIERGRERLLTRAYAETIAGATVSIPLIVSDAGLLGFTTDGGTIPRLAWPIVGHPFGPYFIAYLRHDHRWAMTHEYPGMSFRDTNDLLFEDLLHYGASRALAHTVYRAVQTGGAGIWRRGRRRVGDFSHHYMLIEQV